MILFVVGVTAFVLSAIHFVIEWPKHGVSYNKVNLLHCAMKGRYAGLRKPSTVLYDRRFSDLGQILDCPKCGHVFRGSVVRAHEKSKVGVDNRVDH